MIHMHCISCGIPQGSVFKPLVFNMVVNDLTLATARINNNNNNIFISYMLHVFVNSTL